MVGLVGARAVQRKRQSMARQEADAAVTAVATLSQHKMHCAALQLHVHAVKASRSHSSLTKPHLLA
jgi:hypothetical protein